MWVGDDIEAETGRSIVGWLFDGWQPEIYNFESGTYDERKTFIGWCKYFRRMAAMPRERYIYSAPITHIQQMLDQNEWSKFDFRRDPCASSRKCRSELLRPKTLKIGEHARIGVLVHHSYPGHYCDGRELINSSMIRSTYLLMRIGMMVPNCVSRPVVATRII